jgi:hypothetical protein
MTRMNITKEVCKEGIPRMERLIKYVKKEDYIKEYNPNDDDLKFK